MKFLKTIISSLKHTKILILIFFILSIVLNYLTTYIPVIIQYFIDVLLNQSTNNIIIEHFINLFNNKLSFIPIMCILLLIVQGIIVLSTYIRTITKNKIIQEFQFELKLKLFNHIQNLTYQDFYQNSLADLVQNSTDDVNNVVSFIEKQFTYILDVILIIIFAVTQLINIDFRLSSVMAVAISFIILLSIWYFKKSKPIIENRIKVQREMYDNLNDNYSNIKFMKINNLQEKERFNKINNNNYEANKSKVIIDSWYNMLTVNIVKIQTPFIFIIGAFLYAQGFITIGIIYVTINYSNKVTRAFTDLAEILEFFNLCMVSFKRLNNLLNLTLEDDEVKDKNIQIQDTTIKFKNASIIVNGKRILKNLNFTIKPNEKVMIVGSTGSGKSILLKTLVGFYEYEGSITIGGNEVRDLNKKMVRKNISYVFQEPVILNMSIKDNLIYGNENINIEDLINVCKEIGINEKIESFEQGYDTIINAETDILSYGEKQLLSFAKAILKNGSIVILDEVTSNLDLEFEKNVMEANKVILKNKISFVIAHRINTIKDADLIIFIDNKQIVEMGNHDELIEKHGYYYDLYMSKEKVLNN